MVKSLRLLCRSLILAACLLILAPSIPGVAQEPGGGTQSISVSPRRIKGMAFSPDGRLLAGMSEDDVVIWAVQKLHVVKVLALTCGEPAEVGWSPDSRYLATAASGGFGDVHSQIMVWRTDTWQPVAAYQTYGFLNACAFVADKPQMIVMGNDRTVALWDFARDKTIRRVVWPTDRQSAYRLPWVRAYLGREGKDRNFSFDGDVVSPLDGTVANTQGQDESIVTLTPSAQKASRIPFHHVLPWCPAKTAYRAEPRKKVGPWVSVKAVPGLPITPGEIAAAAANRIAKYDSGAVHCIALAHEAPRNNRAGGGDIVIQRSNGQTVKTRSYRVPDDPIHLSLSPNGKYLVYMMGPEPVDAMDTYRYRVLDLANARLSSCATVGSYTEGITWSPDSRYLSLYDGGLAAARYYTLQVLLCWDFKRNRSRNVVSAWNIKDDWTSNGRLRFHVEHGGGGEFDPATGIITLLPDTPLISVRADDRSR